MKANVGNVDRAIRIIAGIGIIASGYYFDNWWGIVGLLPLATGLFGRCGLYQLVGTSTCSAKEKPAES